MSDRTLRLLMGALALVGAGISAYLTVARLTGAAIVCGTGGCEAVQSSPYAEVLGIPVSTLGLAAYLLILASTAGRGELGLMAGTSLALAGFGFSTYLTSVQLFVIDAVCRWCLASDSVMTLLAALALLRLRSPARRRPAPRGAAGAMSTGP